MPRSRLISHSSEFVFECCLAPIERDAALAVEEVADPGLEEQWFVVVIGAGEKARERFRRRFDALARAGTPETPEPRRQSRQIGPAYRQRPEGVQEPSRHACEGTRHGKRDHLGDRDSAGIAK